MRNCTQRNTRLCLKLTEVWYSAAGFTYSRRNDLPEGTILIENMNMTIIDSSFTNLAAFGQASVILLNSIVYFDNVTFNGNYQSEAGAINVNQTSNATIVNSVFTNNFGYQAGAIAVGCKHLILRNQWPVLYDVNRRLAAACKAENYLTQKL